MRAIAETGSISAGARRLGMSYRRAWLLVDTMNRCFRAPVVETVSGGRGGGGARVTALGRDVLDRYDAMERTAADSLRGQMRAFAALLSDSPADPADPPARR